jgi:ABC-type nitrate/sulfonate/bicarbonate transport system ATPase subunit
MLHVQVHNLNKSFRNRRKHPRKFNDAGQSLGDQIAVLNNINLDIKKGELVCILGPSGCGKSTLLRIIAGFEQPSSGRVVVDNEAVHRPRSNHIFVFQECGLLPWMTVIENVGLGIRHMPESPEKQNRILEYIEIAELEGFEHHYPHQLSGGMQRRAELARAMAVNPEMLIMDEPFSGLDFLTHMKMREEVVNMHEFFHKTTLVVTHDIDDALIMGDRIVVLSGRPSNVKLNQVLDFSRPRNFEKEPELSRLRGEVFLMLGVPYAV